MQPISTYSNCLDGPIPLGGLHPARAGFHAAGSHAGQQLRKKHLLPAT